MARRAAGAPRVVLRFTLTPEERDRAYGARIEQIGGAWVRRIMGWLPLLAIAVVATAAFPLVDAARRSGALSGGAALGISALLVLLAAPAVVWSVPGLRRKVLFGRGGEEAVAVGAEGIEWSRGGAEPVAVGWAEVVTAEWRGGLLLLALRGGQAIVVPERVLGTPERRRFNEIARKQMGGRARLHD